MSAVERLFEAVARGELSPAEAAARLPEVELAQLGDAALDLAREARRGRPEAIYGEGKTPDQVARIARRLLEAGQNVIATRISAEAFREVEPLLAGLPLDYAEDARLLRIMPRPVPRRSGLVAVLCAGTTDLPVAREAALTAEFHGSPVELAADVGVAGLHRLLGRSDLLRRARVLVVVAGMEGALPSVVAGLVKAPVIAVPTSVGYGAHLGGVAPLLTMLSSCAPGIAVVNIDNGFGAGYLADAINALGDGVAG
ncbi:MAG: nickel pincer cofactor biosynthesis protein LarB [Candidatus Sumerlaeia bacterium]|nr:nickel pincer cofactor biosynthesis protein LarB [Candidatus Sumerlaeia bacterium]